MAIFNAQEHAYWRPHVDVLIPFLRIKPATPKACVVFLKTEAKLTEDTARHVLAYGSLWNLLTYDRDTKLWYHSAGKEK